MSEFVQRVLAGIALAVVLVVGAFMCVNEYNSYVTKVTERQTMIQQIAEMAQTSDSANVAMAAKLDAYYAK
jgi:hypothetical protein